MTNQTDDFSKPDQDRTGLVTGFLEWASALAGILRHVADGADGLVRWVEGLKAELRRFATPGLRPT
ncbi:hypothetical protein GCM10009639_67590 [Kitasatospora putterlickiae]|uniref:Uncharacterized protein n=1 Tax=Kitasatospora putterlickiae TaxID=221725 RepID=A0ABN1YJE3_9ACTN